MPYFPILTRNLLFYSSHEPSFHTLAVVSHRFSALVNYPLLKCASFFLQQISYDSLPSWHWLQKVCCWHLALEDSFLEHLRLWGSLDFKRWENLNFLDFERQLFDQSIKVLHKRLRPNRNSSLDFAVIINWGPCVGISFLIVWNLVYWREEGVPYQGVKWARLREVETRWILWVKELRLE